MEPKSQVQWLRRDIEAIRQVVTEEAHIFDPLVTTEDIRDHAYFEVVASLFWAVVDYSAAVQHLLGLGLRTPIIPVQRAILEVTASLRLIRFAEDPKRETLLFRAFALLRESRLPVGSGDPDRATMLEMIPGDILNEARERLQRRRGWHGMTIRDHLERAGFSNYDAYGYMAEQSHGSVHFYNTGARVVAGVAQFRLGYPLHPYEAEMAANFTRRLLLECLRTFWLVFGSGRALSLHSDDAEAWFARQAAT